MKKFYIKSIARYYILFILLGILIFVSSSFLLGYGQNSPYLMSWVAVTTSVLSISYLIIATNHIYGHSLALLTYLIFTQFGTCLVVYVLDLVELPRRGYYYTEWIYAESYPKAIQLGVIAVIIFTLAVVWKGNRLDRIAKKKVEKKSYLLNSMASRQIAVSGILIVGAIFLFLVYLLLSGKISLTSSYRGFLQYSQSNQVWSLAMTLLPIGFSFAITTGKKLDLKILYILYALISIILLFTGNKGEVLYAVLAGFGVYCYKNNSINKRIVIYGLVIVLIIIPTITSFRSTSVYEMLGSYIVSLSDPFIEMGYQIRLSVFMIDGIESGTREYLYGFSYINPIVNIINRLFPFIPRLSRPNNFDFDTTYDTMGFSQVAESYANFGFLGVVIFFVVMGLILAKFDNVDIESPKSALYAAWLVIFINMTRNVFAFVIGQVLMVYIIWKLLCTIRLKNNK